MPLYEYRCLTCGHEFEALVRPPEVPTCENCHSAELERLLSMFAVSSDSTRQASLSKARKANKKVMRDKAIADQEEIDHHRH
jgi:putative FmdB family regulatory protein